MSSAVEYPTNGSALGEAGTGSRVVRARLVDDKVAHQLSTSVPTAASPRWQGRRRLPRLRNATRPPLDFG